MQTQTSAGVKIDLKQGRLKKLLCSMNVNDIMQTVFTFTCEIKVLETKQILVPTLKNVLR